MRFKKIGIFSRHPKPGITDTLTRLIHFLQQRKCSIFLNELLTQWFHCPDLPALSALSLMKEVDLVVAVGGDGNFLDAARYAVSHHVPIVGINQGRMGFLTDIKPSHLEEELGAFLDGQFSEEKRFLLQTSFGADFSQPFVALNEVTWVSDNPARMIEFEIFVQGELLMRERSNGLIISTPTGSTAYALAAGGPVLHPSVEGIILVSMLPQALARCPIVIPAHFPITLHLLSKAKASVQVYGDSIPCYRVLPNEKAVVHQLAQPLKLLHPPSYHYFNTLREKLKM